MYSYLDTDQYRNFKLLVQESMARCWSASDYMYIRRLLHKYGIDRFKQEVDMGDNDLSLIINGKLENECTDVITSNDFTLIQPSNAYGKRHRLLCPNPSILELLFGDKAWMGFNVLTFEGGHISLLDQMESIAMQYTRDYGWSKNVELYFHCYPFNSINTLHLHIVDLECVKPLFYTKGTINLSLKTVRSVLLMS